MSKISLIENQKKIYLTKDQISEMEELFEIVSKTAKGSSMLVAQVKNGEFGDEPHFLVGFAPYDVAVQLRGVCIVDRDGGEEVDEEKSSVCLSCGNEHMRLLTDGSYYCDECGDTRDGSK